MSDMLEFLNNPNMHEKELTIVLKMTRQEAKRLSDMCDHISEEAHDMPYDDEETETSSEPWYKEEWWTSLSDTIRDQMRNSNIPEFDVIG